MLNVTDVAMYFINKDDTNQVFNKKLVDKSNRYFYDGNARLNKLLHLTQNIYIAKTGQKLFDADFYAYDNGAVVVEVQENYSMLLEKKYTPVSITGDDKIFLDKIYTIMKNASTEELIALSHEDDEWVNKQNRYHKSEQKMDSMARADEYKKQYADVLLVMDNMG